jgi:hypothetical protein
MDLVFQKEKSAAANIEQRSEALRSSDRGGGVPDDRFDYFGFRLSMTL